MYFYRMRICKSLILVILCFFVLCFQVNVLFICISQYDQAIKKIVCSTETEDVTDTPEEQERGEEEYQETWEYINALNHYKSCVNVKPVNFVLTYLFDFSSLIKDIPVPPPKQA